MKNKPGPTDHWPASGGRNAYRKFLSGGAVTRSQAILAKCAECCGGYVDGKDDCEVPRCPLYPFMPYRRPGKAPD